LCAPPAHAPPSATALCPEASPCGQHHGLSCPLASDGFWLIMGTARRSESERKERPLPPCPVTGVTMSLYQGHDSWWAFLSIWSLPRSLPLPFPKQ
jgi:hypothetical protein